MTAPKDLLRRAFETLNTGDLEAAAEFLLPDLIQNLPGLPEPLIGRDIWTANTQMFLAAFPDLNVTIDDIFGEDDKVAMRLTFRGTHTGDFLGNAATGREVSFKSVELYRVEGDKIAEEWVSPDINSLMGQIAS